MRLAWLLICGLAANAAHAAVEELPSSTLPLSHAAALSAPVPDLQAGAAYLADPVAQQWLSENRPDIAPHLTARALAIEDWRQTLTGFDRPRRLRDALLGRTREELAANPELAVAVAAKSGADASLVANAILDWTTLPRPLAERARAEGLNEAAWSRLDLKQRYAISRLLAQNYAREKLAAPPSAAAYAKAYEDVLRVWGPLMTDAELDEHSRRLTQAQHAASAIAAAERQAGSFAGSRLAMPEAGLPFTGELESAPKRLPFTDDERSRVSTKLQAALVDQLRGSAAAAETARFYSAHPLAVEVLPMGRAGLGSYEPTTGKVGFSEEGLVDALEALGRDPRSLLDDGETVEELAMALSPILVHEAAHQKQFEDALDRGLSRNEALRLYNHGWEHEAFTVQSTYLESRRRNDPRFAALVARMEMKPALNDLLPWREQVTDPARFASDLRSQYRRLPTFEGAVAARIRAAIERQPLYSGLLPAIARELTRRRGLPVAERVRLEKEGDAEPLSIGADSLSGVTTSELRRLSRALPRAAAHAAEEGLGMIARSRAAIARAQARLDEALRR